VVTDDDLAAVPLKPSDPSRSSSFVPIDSDGQTTRFVKQAYYLEPEPIARKAFFLLKDVLAERGLRAIAKIVLRDREQLASIDPYASTMLLSTLHWPDEIRSLGELSLPEIEVEAKPAERAMAAQLVDAMTTEFDPAAYHDEYREALLGIIEAKAGGAVIAAPAPASAAGVTDLMAALEASVAAARTARASAAPETIEEQRLDRLGGPPLRRRPNRKVKRKPTPCRPGVESRRSRSILRFARRRSGAAPQTAGRPEKCLSRSKAASRSGRPSSPLGVGRPIRGPAQAGPLAQSQACLAPRRTASGVTRCRRLARGRPISGRPRVALPATMQPGRSGGDGEFDRVADHEGKKPVWSAASGDR